MPSVITTLGIASKIPIDGSVMKRINYYDLQYLVIEHQIQIYNQMIKQKIDSSLAKRNIERRRASDEELNNIFN